MSRRTNIKKRSVVNKDYGRKQYVSGQYDMTTPTEFAIKNAFTYRDSEFKKPYGSYKKVPFTPHSYVQMEHFFPSTHWGEPDEVTPDEGDLPGFEYGLGGCKEETIGYTTLSMQQGETQKLRLVGGQSFFQYEWEAAGTGVTTRSLYSRFSTTNADGEASYVTFDSTGVSGTITIQLLSRDTDEVCDEIEIEVSACAGGTIGYTTLDMESDELQTLTVVNPREGYTYTWVLVGSGSLSAATGNSTILNPTNTGGNHTIVVSLYTSDTLCDSISVFVRCEGGSWVCDATWPFACSNTDCTLRSGPYTCDTAITSLGDGTGVKYRDGWACVRPENCSAGGCQPAGCAKPANPGCEGNPNYDFYELLWVKEDYCDWVC